MEPTDYGLLSTTELMALAIWREARGEGYLGKRGVAHVIWNRANKPGWWGHTVEQVVLKPYQFSSFNASDPNSTKWPSDADPSWKDCLTIADAVLSRDSDEQGDLTNGATYYFSPPLDEPPHAWGSVEVTVRIGNLTFCKPVVVPMGADESTQV